MDSQIGTSAKAAGNPIIPLFLVVLLDLIGVGIVIPLLAPLLLSQSSQLVGASMQLDMRVLILGLLISSYSIAQFFGSPILGALSDKHGRKRILLISLAVTFVGYILFAFGIIANNLALLFVSRIVAGFTGGSISVAYSAIADVSEPKDRPRNFGLVGMAFGFGFIIGPFLGGKLADPSLVSWFDFSTPFFFAALLSLVDILAVMFLFKETLHTKVETRIDAFTGIRNFARAFQMPSLRTIFVFVFLLAFGFSFFTQFSQVYLVERFNFNQSQIGDVFAWVGIWIAITQGVIAGVVAKKFSPEQVLRLSPLGLALSIALVMIAWNPDMLIFIFPLIAISQGMIYPNYTAIISKQAGPESQGEIMGISQSVQSVALAVPPIISGLIVAVSLTLPLIVSVLLIIAGWIMYLAFYKSTKKEVFHEV